MSKADTPAAAEPQAAELLPCPFCAAVMSMRRGPGITVWDHPNDDCLLKSYCLTERGVPAWNRRPTPDTTAPASAPAVGGEGIETRAWAWLRQEKADFPEDIGFSADEMVDAYIAGAATRPPPPRADAAADDVAALRERFSRIFYSKDYDRLSSHHRTNVDAAVLASTQRKEG